MISIGTAYAVTGAAIALGTAGLSTAIGCGVAGISAAGAVAENKEHFKNSMLLQALPQTQTIYAFITGLFILIGAGLMGAEKDISTAHGLVMLAAGIVVAITSISAVLQGMVSSAGIAACTKNKDAFVPSLVFAGQCETPAIFGFIFAIMILVIGLKVF
jgi:V/A-type H+/Na+-transporting ATPase subunit K